jgi:predicted nucleic acid-binding protein
MGNHDMMIGAQALASGLILVTNDQAFSRIKGLKIEDWARPRRG